MEYRVVKSLAHSVSDEDKKYGVPEQKKFPMPDARHVRSAIKFFNYVEPRYEKELADAILNRMKEYGLSFDDFTVGEENRFSKYIPKDELEHHGILGMKWGVRRYQNEDGSLTEAGKKHYAKVEATQAKKADIEKRKQTAADRKKLVKMAKKHPDWLTDQELDQLNNRYNKENNFDRNYNKGKNKQSKEKSDIKKALVSEIVTPAAVELGKAAIASVISGGNFEKIAASRLSARLFDLSDVNKYWRGDNSGNKQNNQSNKQKPKPKKTTGTFKKK